MNNNSDSNNACIEKFEWSEKLTAITNLFVAQGHGVLPNPNVTVCFSKSLNGVVFFVLVVW